MKYLNENDPSLAEQSISHALKVLSASPRSSHFGKEKAQCFHSLARLYLTRASHQLTKEDFCETVIKSIALYEGERIYKHGSYTEDKEIDSAISEAELNLVEKIFGDDAVEKFKSAGDKRISNRIKLNEIRSKITNEYFPTLASLPKWGSKDEQERCDAIERIYETIHDDMKSFVGEIFRFCSEIAGPAPCNYSIVGLGSTSRKESTPYSDLEFGILLGRSKGEDDFLEQRAYFRFLTYFIQSQIVKLGETILPSLGIASLNDFYSEKKQDDWFFDDMIPRGFSFDGMMPWACKTPLGRKAWQGEPPLEFIMTIDEMLELQNVIPASSSGSLETAHVFSRVCHLYGDTELTENYQQKLSAMLTGTDRVKKFQQVVVTSMKSLLDTYQVETLVSTNFGTQQNVKREVYRLASLLIEQISKFFGIFSPQSSWQCIKEMRERKILSFDGAKNLLAMLSITTELRLQCYQKHGRQKEALPTVPQLSLVEKESNPNSPTVTIVRLYLSLLPLNLAVSQIVDNQVSPDDPEPFARSVLLEANLLDLSPLTRALAYLRILQLPKALLCLRSVKEAAVDGAKKVEILLVMAHCYRMVGKFQNVLECSREAQTLYSTAPETINKNDLLSASVMVMLAYMDLGLFQEAVKMHEQIMDQKASDFEEDSIDEDHLDFLNSSVVLFINVQQYRTAETILRRIIEKLPTPRKSYSRYFACINNFAVVLLEENRLSEAKTILEDALSITTELYGENAIHPHVAHCLTNLSKVHYGLQNREEANRLLQLALIIYRRVHGQQDIDPSIIEALITQARAYQFAGKWEEMQSTLVEAKQAAHILYQDQPHPSVATVYLLLGHCEQVRGRCSVAFSHYQECLKIREDHSKEIHGHGHDCETASVLLRIASLGKMCCFQGSYLLSLIQKALEMEEEVHGKKSNHTHLALCLSSLGYRLMQESNGAQGFEYLERAIQMLEEMKLNDTYTYGYTHLTIGTVLRDYAPNKAEKHLLIAAAILKKVVNDDNHIILLQVNSSLLHVFKKTNRIQEGFQLAKVQRELIDTRLSKSGQLSLRELYHVYWLSSFYEDCGQRTTALALYNELISRLEQYADPTDPKDEHLMFLLWMIQEAVAAIYQSNEMFLEAEAMYHRCTASTQKSSSQHPFVLEARLAAQLHLASILAQTGRDAQAYDILDGLLKTYERDPELIGSMLALSVFRVRGELHHRRFRFEQAVQDLKKALKIAEDVRTKESTGVMATRANEAYAKIMNAIGLIYEQGNSLEQALDCYKRCLETVKVKQLTIDTATFHQNIADTLKKLGSMDDALIHYKKSLEIREVLYSEDTVREDIATVLYHIAETQFMCGRPKEASETLDKLLPLRRNLLKKGGLLQNYCAALTLKGNCHIVQPGEAKEAKEAYEEAEKVLKKITTGQPNQDYASVISNIGYACQLLNQWDEAICKLRQALEMKKAIYREVKSSPEVALACFLLAEALLKHKQHEEALVYFREALKIHESLQSIDDVVECLLNIGQCYKDLKKLGKAMETFDEVKELCSTSKTLDRRMILRFHKEMANVYTEEVEDKSKTLVHLQEATAILTQLDKTENDEETLNELQAKILSLQFG